MWRKLFDIMDNNGDGSIRVHHQNKTITKRGLDWNWRDSKHEATGVGWYYDHDKMCTKTINGASIMKAETPGDFTFDQAMAMMNVNSLELV